MIFAQMTEYQFYSHSDILSKLNLI